MKIPIILTSTKGKTQKQLAKESIEAIRNFWDKKGTAEKKQYQRSLPNKHSEFGTF